MPLPSRRRSIAGAAPKQPTLELVQLAAQTYKLNAEQNAAKSAYEKTRVALYSKMKSEGFSHFTADAVIGTKTVAVEAKISAPVGSAISIELLRKLVDEATFLKIVSASKAAVEEHAGAAVATQASVESIGKENVTVKALK